MPLTTEDRLAGHELVSLHGHIADDGAIDDLERLMTADAVYDVEDYGLGRIEGLPAIRRLFAERPGDQPVGHHVTNVVVAGQADDTVRVRSKGLSVMADGRAGTVNYED